MYEKSPSPVEINDRGGVFDIVKKNNPLFDDQGDGAEVEVQLLFVAFGFSSSLKKNRLYTYSIIYIYCNNNIIHTRPVRRASLYYTPSRL